MAALPDLLLILPGGTYYRRLTLDEIVDVLCAKPPESVRTINFSIVSGRLFWLRFSPGV